MLTDAQIEQNRIEFLKLVAEIDIPGADTQGLVEYLDSSDFFTAPASTQYHCGYKGGLCEHSMNVYHNLVKLIDSKAGLIPKYDNNSLLIVALFHDISKTNFYEMYVMNKKKYFDQGTKHDNMGKFDWIAEEAYKVKEPENRFVTSTHEVNSFLILSRYIPMTEEEIAAVINHMGPKTEGEMKYESTNVYNRYPLASLLYMADFMSTFVDERLTNE